MGVLANLTGGASSGDNHRSPIGAIGGKIQKWTDPIAWIPGVGDKWVDLTSNKIPEKTNRVLSKVMQPFEKIDKAINPVRQIPAVDNVGNWIAQKPADTLAMAMGAMAGGAALAGAGAGGAGGAAGTAGAGAGTTAAGTGGMLSGVTAAPGVGAAGEVLAPASSMIASSSYSLPAASSGFDWTSALRSGLNSQGQGGGNQTQQATRPETEDPYGNGLVSPQQLAYLLYLQQFNAQNQFGQGD